MMSLKELQEETEYLVYNKNYIFYAYINKLRDTAINTGSARIAGDIYLNTIRTFVTFIDSNATIRADWFAKSHELFPRLVFKKRLK